MRLVFIVIFLCSVCFGEEILVPQARDDFYQRALTRSWEFGVRQIEHESPAGRVSLQRSMVAFAFRYWVLLENKMLFKDVAFEGQVRASFAAKRIEVKYLEDPLGRKDGDGPRLVIPEIKIKDEEYAAMAGRFREFLLEEDKK